MARFATQVAVHRDCLAVRDRELALTYGELDSWANGIANETLARGGGGSNPVALFLPQGAPSIAGILGVLKSGSPYVSLDQQDPRSVRTSSSALTHGSCSRMQGMRHITRGSRRTARALRRRRRPRGSPGIEPSPDDIAYVFFTSGSTGKPKGVFDSHRNVLHNVLRYSNTLLIAPRDRLSLVQSPVFSGTVSTLFSGLLNGASLFPFRLDEHGVAGLARWLLAERVTLYHSVPAIFRALVQVEAGPFDDIRIVRLEGDRAASLDVELQRRHFPPRSVLVNGLGLTETGLVRQLFVSRNAAEEPGVLPVGYSVPGVDVVVVDDDETEVPSGTAGEMRRPERATSRSATGETTSSRRRCSGR